MVEGYPSQFVPANAAVATAIALTVVEPCNNGIGSDAFAIVWDGKTLSAWIEKTYGVQLGVRQCQRLFRQFEFRIPKPISKTQIQRAEEA